MTFSKQINHLHQNAKNLIDLADVVDSVEIFFDLTFDLTDVNIGISSRGFVPKCKGISGNALTDDDGLG